MSRASRSLRVHHSHIQSVKEAVGKNGYRRQTDLADELQYSLATISSYLNGKPVDRENFHEISHKLGFQWHNIADLDTNDCANSHDEKLEIATNYAHEEQSTMYISRSLDTICYETLFSPGALIRIKAPRRMGKTTLMVRTMAQLATQSYQTVCINLHLATETDCENLDRFLKWFCISVGQGLNLPNRLKDYWDEEFSTSKIDCTEYFEKYLLAQKEHPLVLCLDEVERIFPHPQIAREFLGLLRAWHEQAKIRPIWGKFRLVLAHSTEVYVPLKINESPFNVGLQIELPDLTRSEVQELAKLYQVNWTEVECDRLMELVGGHPYLVEIAIETSLQKNLSLDQILQNAAIETGIYGNHLRHLRHVIEGEKDLLDCLNRVLMSPDPVKLDSQQAYQLHSMGLVLLQGNLAKSRYKLYQQYFSEHLGDQK